MKMMAGKQKKKYSQSLTTKKVNEIKHMNKWKEWIISMKHKEKISEPEI